MDYLDIFQSECTELVSYDGDPRLLVEANKFIKLASKISTRYPLLFIPSFIEDFMTGVFSTKIMKKYSLQTFNNLSSLATLCGLKGTRIKNSTYGAFEKNLQNIKFKEPYEFLTRNSDIFSKQLVNLLNHNILQSIITYTIIKSQYIRHDDVTDLILQSYNELKPEILILSDTTRRESFEAYLHDNTAEKIMNIIKELHDNQHITRMDGSISILQKYTEVADYAYKIINDSKDGISYSSLQTKFLNRYPLFRLLPDVKMFDEILDKIEQNQSIVRKKAFWKYTPNNDQFFTAEIFSTKIEHEKIRMINAGRTKFFGRHITPDQFVEELKTLDLGDLDDLDDQVTRIAGLVLSDAAMLQSPRENSPEFDFIVDLTNYNFRPEQEEIMKKLDFQATSNIFHCKIMVNDTITPDTITNLRNKIPDGEQGVLFTCTKVSSDILQHTKDDRTIQIIDEEGIRNWCSITPTIPCRLHSVAKIMYGEHRGSIVLIKSLNYESGLATVETMPDYTETTLQIGCMQEIDLHASPDDFESASDKFCNFLCNLANLASFSLEDAMNAEIKVHRREADLQKSLHPEAFDDIDPTPDSNSKPFSLTPKYFEFDNGVYVSVKPRGSINDMFDCNCSHKLNENYLRTLCRHQLAAIVHFCTGENKMWHEINASIETMNNKILMFKQRNIEDSIQAIGEVCGDESDILFKEYLQAYIDSRQA